MPDINYLIAIDTRYVGEAALARKGDARCVELAFRFMNSYLRAALNAREVRTAYNVLNQYRLLVESMIRGRADDLRDSRASSHMIYYGRTSYDMQLGFVTETVAYDVSALCEFAHAQGRGDSTTRCSTLFLELDQPLRHEAARSRASRASARPRSSSPATTSRSARSQAREQIAADMAGRGPRAAASSIREQLERVESKEFWEIIDRGRNFEYMPPKQKDQMDKFFAMLGCPAAHANL